MPITWGSESLINLGPHHARPMGHGYAVLFNVKEIMMGPLFICERPLVVRAAQSYWQPGRSYAVELSANENRECSFSSDLHVKRNAACVHV